MALATAPGSSHLLPSTEEGDANTSRGPRSENSQPWFADRHETRQQLEAYAEGEGLGSDVFASK